MGFITNKIFTKAFLITIIRYGLVALGGWLVGEGRMDPGTWETILGGAMVAITAALGGADSTTDKVVANGRSIALDKLTEGVKQQVEAQASVKPSRNWLDVFLGK